MLTQFSCSHSTGSASWAWLMAAWRSSGEYPPFSASWSSRTSSIPVFLGLRRWAEEAMAKSSMLRWALALDVAADPLAMEGESKSSGGGRPRKPRSTDMVKASMGDWVCCTSIQGIKIMGGFEN